MRDDEEKRSKEKGGFKSIQICHEDDDEVVGERSAQVVRIRTGVVVACIGTMTLQTGAIMHADRRC